MKITYEQDDKEFQETCEAFALVYNRPQQVSSTQVVPDEDSKEAGATKTVEVMIDNPVSKAEFMLQCITKHAAEVRRAAAKRILDAQTQEAFAAVVAAQGEITLTVEA